MLVSIFKGVSFVQKQNEIRNKSNIDFTKVYQKMKLQLLHNKNLTTKQKIIMPIESN